MKRALLLAILSFAAPLFFLSASSQAQAGKSPSASWNPAGTSDERSALDSTALKSPTEEQGQSVKRKKKIGIVIFPGFEVLDVYGPMEVWGELPDYEVVTVSEHGGSVKSVQGIATVATYSFKTAPQFDILMVSGGAGSRREIDNPAMLNFLRKQDQGTEWTTSVCTGSAVLAKAGILNGRKATSNKIAFKWVTNQGKDVLWQKHARWVVDGKYVTSSGVSAGIDMALRLVEMLHGRALAESIARSDEYIWNDNPNNDPFAVN